MGSDFNAPLNAFTPRDSADLSCITSPECEIGLQCREASSGAVSCNETSDINDIFKKLEWTRVRQLNNGIWRLEGMEKSKPVVMDVSLNRYDIPEMIDLSSDGHKRLSISADVAAGQQVVSLPNEALQLIDNERANQALWEKVPGPNSPAGMYDIGKYNKRGAFLMALGSKKYIDDSSSCRVVDQRNAGDARKVMVVMPHQDDEASFAKLRTIVERVGPENVMVLYITNDDGNGWKMTPEDRAAFAETKMELGRRSCEKLGIPRANVRTLPESEVGWYDGFITPTVEKLEKENPNDPMLTGLPADFKKIPDLPRVAYKTSQWIYSNMKEFRPDVVITGDRMNTVQMHDWANILTNLATRQYQAEEGREIKRFVFPQQNVKPGDSKRYSWYPTGTEKSFPIMRFDLDGFEQNTKSDIAWHYAKETWKDMRLMFGYWLSMNMQCLWGSIAELFGSDDRGYYGTCEYSTTEYLRPINLDIATECPPPELLGFAFEGNTEHRITNVPHTCQNDFDDVLSGIGQKSGLIAMTDRQPFFKDYDKGVMFADASDALGDSKRSPSERMAAIQSLEELLANADRGSEIIVQVAKAAADTIISNTASSYSKGDRYLGKDSLVYTNGNLRDLVSRSAMAVLVKCGKSGLDVSPYLRDVMRNASAGDVAIAAKTMDAMGISDQETVSALAQGMRSAGGSPASDENKGYMLELLAKVGADNKDALQTFVWALNGGVKYGNLSAKGYRHGGYIALQNINSYVKKHGMDGDMRDKIGAALAHAIQLEEKDRTGIDSQIAKDYVELVVRYPNEDRMLPSAKTLLALLQKNESATGVALAQLDKSLTPLSSNERIQLCQALKKNFKNVS